MDITLADLLIIEPRLTATAVLPPQEGAPYGLERIDVSWAVSVRATPPHLPVLRGGEILLVPDRIGASLGSDLPVLLREAALRHASAAVVSGGPFAFEDVSTSVGELQFLSWRGDLTPEAEAGINRRLTECRGELYRVGSELERQIAELTASRAGAGAISRAVSETLGLPVAVLDRGGLEIAAFDDSEQQAKEDYDADCPVRVERELPSGATVQLGPLHPRQQVVARFFIPRIAVAVEAALQRDDESRPRGPRRIEAARALLANTSSRSSEQRLAALALGLDPDSTFFVAVSTGGSEAAVHRALTRLGAVHPAGSQNEQLASLVVVNSRRAGQSLAMNVLETKRQWEIEQELDRATLALSAPAAGVTSVPGAAREAHLVALLQSRAILPKRAAAFGSIEDVGALSLLYQLRESSELRRFVDETLGKLEQRDRRGALRATLRAFLESGGSHVDASQRLGIHRNTLAYRLRRIGELVGRDIADPGSWLTLHLAIQASDMIKATADGS